MPMIGDSQVRQCREVIPQARYENSQKREENHWGNKINLVVKESSNTEASVYHHVIDQY